MQAIALIAFAGAGAGKSGGVSVVLAQVTAVGVEVRAFEGREVVMIEKPLFHLIGGA